MADPIQDMQPGNVNPENIAELAMQEEHFAEAMVAVNKELEMPLLHSAAEKGFTSIVEHLLSEGADADTRYGDDDQSPLDLAAIRGHLETMRALLDHGVDANSARSCGQTTLHAAVHHGRVDIIDLLLNAGADVNARTVQGLTPLHFAACLPESGDAAGILLRRGADKDALTVVGMPPLHLAAQYGNLSATRALLAAGADEALRGHNDMIGPVDAAACYGQVEAIRVLAQHGLYLDATPVIIGCTALHRVARNNDAVVVDALVEAGASVTVQLFEGGITPLHSAAESLALEAVRALLRHGAPVLALPVRASQEGDGGGVANSRTRNESPLHVAVRQGGREGAAEVVDLLLKWGADESELDNDGKTAAELVGASVEEDWGLAADADRVRELLANAPGNRAWRRRGLLLLCLARERRRRMRRGRKSGGKGKEEGAPVKDVGGGGGGGGNGSTVPSCAVFEVSSSVSAVPSVSAAAEAAAREEAFVAMMGPRKRERTLGTSGCMWERLGCDGDSNSGCHCRWCSRESGGDLEGVVASLLEFREEGFFRTIVGYL